VTSTGAARSTLRPRAQQALELVVAPDERAADATRPHQRQRSQDRPARHALRLALRLDRARVAELEGGARSRDRALARQDLTRLRRLLQAGRDVDGVTADEGAALAGRACHDLAGIDAHPQCESLLQAALHRERRVQRALRVVLERLRRAKRGHHGVPRELLDRPAGAPDLLRHGVVEALQPQTGALGVLLGRKRC
jgi:hypothetical protein